MTKRAGASMIPNDNKGVCGSQAKVPSEQPRGLLRKLTFSALAITLGLLLIEGLSSVVLFLYVVVTRSEVATERRHTRYDPELGWVALPNLSVPDLYGPGIFFRTNSRGFRNDEETANRVPPGKARIICSGDSFTLGHGVNNGQTWCHFLSVLDPTLQTVNMGQGGYGIDQAYLWYKRDGLPLEHQVHVFAFISDDFTRMRFTDFFGYGKPRLRVRDAAVFVENVPVPKAAFRMPWLAQNLGLIYDLRSVDLFSRVRRRLFPNKQGSSPPWLEQEEVLATALKVFEDLKAINTAKGSILVLVHLPVREDYGGREFSDNLRHYLQRECAARGIVFFDLIDDFQKLPKEQMQRIAARHYTPEGNQYIARSLWSRLKSQPEVAERLSSRH